MALHLLLFSCCFDQAVVLGAQAGEEVVGQLAASRVRAHRRAIAQFSGIRILLFSVCVDLHHVCLR